MKENRSPDTRTYHIDREGDTPQSPTLFPGLLIPVGEVFRLDDLDVVQPDATPPA